MDNEMLKIIEKAARANRRVTRLIGVGGEELRRAKAARAKAEAEFEKACEARRNS